ncbi:hypothetical protein [Kibdelosporangium persicum]|uniref:hypothetical protein n=1 Tax=Kibdelosporangium persicum TaxID=2698649 RepID=UPI001564006D|nr:hypothetical protein [Kibdelosporangium persicum]
MAVVVAALLLIGGVVTVIVLTTRDGTPTASTSRPTANDEHVPTPTRKPTAKPTTAQNTGGEEAVKAVAQAYADAVARKDAAAAKALVCRQRDTGAMYEVFEKEPNPKFVVGKVTMFSQTSATVQMKIEGGSSEGVPHSYIYEGNSWCVEY